MILYYFLQFLLVPYGTEKMILNRSRRFLWWGYNTYIINVTLDAAVKGVSLHPLIVKELRTWNKYKMFLISPSILKFKTLVWKSYKYSWFSKGKFIVSWISLTISFPLCKERKSIIVKMFEGIHFFFFHIQYIMENKSGSHFLWWEHNNQCLTI